MTVRMFPPPGPATRESRPTVIPKSYRNSPAGGGGCQTVSWRFMDPTDYKVELDVYNGPLELLLYLIRKEEVDIHDIPIARITEQYLAHVETIRQIDINLTGEFLVMAATLMEIKSRMLNPLPPDEPSPLACDTVEDGGDPRRQLVRQLLEYKQFKDAANDLQRRAAVERRRFARAAPPGARMTLDLQDVNLFALIDAFNAIMASVGHSAFGQNIVFDDTPIGLYQADILDRLQRDGPLTLQAIFVGRTSRGEMIGLFLAMLELIRFKKLRVEQSEPFGEILLRFHPDAPGEPPSEAPTEKTPGAPEPHPLPP